MASLASVVERYFPYEGYRRHQRELIQFVYEVFRDGAIGLVHAPTGIGKSVSVLVGWLAAWEEGHGNRLLVVTRTKSQLEIYARELRRIKEHSGGGFTASTIKGRQSMCLQEWSGNLSYRDFLSVCKRLREEKRCEYYNLTFDEGRRVSRLASLALREVARGGVVSADELRRICLRVGVCPYEVMRLHSRYADILCGSYNYALMSHVRGALLRSSISRIELVIDEAHSLPQYASGILSDEITTNSLRRASRELREYEVDDYGLVGAVRRCLEEWATNVYDSYGWDREAVVRREDLIERLMDDVDASDEAELLGLIRELVEEGNAIRWRRSLEGRRPISYLARCAEFLEAWVAHLEPYYVRYVMAVEGAKERVLGVLGLRCIDPSVAAAEAINGARATIIMSGTLWSMDYYIDILGVDRSRVRRLSIPPVYPPENRLIMVDVGVTTRYEERNPQQMEEIARRLSAILNAVPGRAAVYFPSYEVMKDVLERLRLDAPLLVERHGMRHEEALEFLSSNPNGVILGVARGKLSEGVDLVEDGRGMLKAVVIVGLPYPRRSELQDATIHYYREKFGARARRYAYELPCLTALAQSAGRLIRTPKDRGIVIIMDRRAAGPFKRKLPPHWRRQMKSYKDIHELVNQIREFFKTNL